MTFYKIQQSYRNATARPYWAKVGYNKYGEIWINMHGGWCCKNEKDEILAVADFPDEDSFVEYHRKDIYSYLIKEDSDLGWLSPEGDFYGCDWAAHEEVANLYFNKSDLELEKEGWIKIFRSIELGEPVYCQHRTSLQQRLYLEDHDIKYHYC